VDSIEQVASAKILSKILQTRVLAFWRTYSLYYCFLCSANVIQL